MTFLALFGFFVHVQAAQTSPFSLVSASGIPTDNSSTGYLYYSQPFGAKGFICDRALIGVLADDVCTVIGFNSEEGASWIPATWLVPRPEALLADISCLIQS